MYFASCILVQSEGVTIPANRPPPSAIRASKCPGVLVSKSRFV